MRAYGSRREGAHERVQGAGGVVGAVGQRARVEQRGERGGGVLAQRRVGREQRGLVCRGSRRHEYDCADEWCKLYCYDY